MIPAQCSPTKAMTATPYARICVIVAPRPRSPTKRNRNSAVSGQWTALCAACTHRMLHWPSQGTAPHRHPIRQDRKQLPGLYLARMQSYLDQVCPQGLVTLQLPARVASSRQTRKGMPLNPSIRTQIGTLPFAVEIGEGGRCRVARLSGYGVGFKRGVIWNASA